MFPSLMVLTLSFLNSDDKSSAAPAPYECGHARTVCFDKTGARFIVITQRGEILYYSSRDVVKPVVITLPRKPSGSIFDRGPSGAALNHEGTQAILFYHDGRVQVWDVVAGRKVKVLPNEHKGLSYAHRSPDGTLVACQSREGGRFEDTGKILLWNTRDWTSAGLIECTDCIYDHCFSPDGRQVVLAVGYPTDRKNNGFTGIVAMDIETKQEVGSIEYGSGFPVRIAMSPDGRWIATGGGDAVPTSPNGRSLSGHLRIFDWKEKKLVAEPYTLSSDYVRALAFSIDGNHLFSGSYEGYNGPGTASVRCFAPSNNWKEDHKIQLGHGNPDLISISPDAKAVFVRDSDALQLIDAQALKFTRTVQKFKFYPEDQEELDRMRGRGAKKKG